MARKYAVEFKARQIGNGFILTGHVQSDNGGAEALEETFYPSLAALDAGISDVLSTAEQVAEGIKAAEVFMPRFTSFLWGGSPGDEDDDGDDD